MQFSHIHDWIPLLENLRHIQDKAYKKPRKLKVPIGNGVFSLLPPDERDLPWLPLFKELQVLIDKLGYKPGYLFYRLEEARPPEDVWLALDKKGYFYHPHIEEGARERFKALREHVGMLRDKFKKQQERLLVLHNEREQLPKYEDVLRELGMQP